MIRFIFIFFSFIVCFSVYAGTIDPSTPDSKYIDYGSKFKHIYKVCGMYEDNTLYCASCVVIDSNWALTAAHVVKESKVCIVKDDSNKYVVSNIICHKDYEPNNFGYYDIALLHIKDSIDLDFYPQMYENEDEVNKVCAIAGYGLTGTFETGIKISDDKKRGGSNKIDKIDRHLLICSPSRVERTELEFLIGSGDSGGGLFIDGKLAGINSCVITSDGKPNSTYLDESGHTRISQYIKWIKENKE